MRRVVHVLTVPDSLLFLRGQVGFMRERGYDLVVVTAPGPALDAFGAREGVEVHGVPMSRRIAPGEDAKSLAILTRLLRELRPDLVHAHTPKGGLLGTTAAALARVPVRIYQLRGLPLATARGVQRTLLAAAERTTCALATHVVANSPSLRGDALAHGLVRASKIRVLGSGSGNGVDAGGTFDPDRIDRDDARRELRARIEAPLDAPIVGFMGRLVRDKGVFELAEAWRRLRERFPAARLVIAGVFEERDAVPPELRAQLERDDRVHLLGFVSASARFHVAVDVIAFPSHREGFPNVPLEAASLRVPVVGARATGTVDAIVDGETGTLVPVGDAAALARALERYLAEPGLARRHGEAARARAVTRFRREIVWEGLAGFYDALLA